MKSHSLLYLIAIVLMAQLQACYVNDDLKLENDAHTNFDALWNIVDQHYCFFEYKGVDWDSVYNHYAPRISNDMGAQSFFNLCGEMLATLQDGHVNLSSAFGSTYYWKWFQDYPVNYDERIIHENYLQFDYYMAGGITYKKLRDNIGYIHYDSFNSSISPTTLDYILAHFTTCDGLIIDVRNNGGGSLNNVEVIASRFITEPILAGYILHKTGPAHSDISEPYPFYFNPTMEHILYGKNVVVLTNRHTFSAANNFVQVMKSLPQVTIIGDKTGGGSGLPFTYNLPNGWNIRLSASPILDAEGNDTEWGIEPDIKVDMASDAQQTGHDTILDCAIEHLIQSTH